MQRLGHPPIQRQDQEPHVRPPENPGGTNMGHPREDETGPPKGGPYVIEAKATLAD